MRNTILLQVSTRAYLMKYIKERLGKEKQTTSDKLTDAEGSGARPPSRGEEVHASYS